MSDELARLMRDGMAAEARTVTAGPEFTERVISRTLAVGGPGGPDRRPPGWHNWILPAVAAVLVGLLVGSVLIGTKLMHSAGSANKPNPTLSQPSSSSSQPSPSSPPSSSPAPSSSATSPSSAAVGGPTGGPVPVGFYAVDLTWVSNDLGWALGTAPCNNRPCTSIVRTRDGGKSWVGIPAPPAELIETDTNTCADNCGRIGYLRFATPLIGYAYGPTALYMTTNGGASWQRQPGFAYGLEVVAGSVLRISAQAPDCQPGCTFGLQRAAIGGTSWQDVSLPAGGRYAAAQLTASGNTVVLATYRNPAGGAEDATAVLFTSTDAGINWHKVGEPCQPRGPVESDSWQATVGIDGSISVLCVQRGPYVPGRSISTTTSTDGTHFTAGAPVPDSKPSTVLGAVSASHLFVLGVNALYASTDAGAHWTAVAGGPPGGIYIGFESASVGRIIGNAGQDGTNGTWTTTDGGQSWTYHPFR